MAQTPFFEEEMGQSLGYIQAAPDIDDSPVMSKARDFAAGLAVHRFSFVPIYVNRQVLYPIPTARWVTGFEEEEIGESDHARKTGHYAGGTASFGRLEHV